MLHKPGRPATQVRTGVNKTNWSNDSTVKISASTVTDNGLSMTSYAANDTSRGLDDFGFSISGDWGTVGFGGSESGDAFATAAPFPQPSQPLYYVMPADESVDSASISYKSPDISGFQFAFGAKPNGNSDSNSMGA